MGKKGERRKRELRRLRKDKRELEKEKARLQYVPKGASQRKQWHQYTLTKATTITVILFENLWGAAILNNMSPVSAYVVFILVNGAIVGFWVWKFIDWIWGKRKFHNLVTIGVVSIAIFIFLVTSPNYISYAIRPKGSIEIEPYTPASTNVTVHYGTRDNDYFYTKTTIGELQQTSQVALKINELPIFTVHILDREVCVDTFVFTGIESQKQHIFSQPVIIKDNTPDRIPEGWKQNNNGTTFEIDNQDGIPVLLMQYKKPHSVTISGLFVTPMGICKVDNDPGNIYKLGDTLSELGTYRVDKVFFVDRPFFNQILDLFRSERIYDLSKY
jgi:hypothetical protein